MRALLRQPGDVRQVHDRFLRALDTHVAGEALRDDVTLVAVARM